MSNGIEIKNLPSATTIKQNDTMTIVQDRENKQLTLDRFANESDLATLSVLENRCDEVKAKIEVDEYSAEITTSQSMSEIGSDDNGANLHENVLDGAYDSCVLKGKTKYIDNDTQEILDTFQDGRNLSLIDVKSPILSNIGKNLFNMKKLINTGVASHSITGESAFTVSNTQANSWQNVRFNIGTLTKGTYVLTFDYNVKSGSHNVALRHGSHGNAMYDMKDNRNIIRLTRDYNDCYLQFFSSGANKETGEVVYSNVMLTKWDGDYEPYKSNTTTFEQKDDKTIVLRSLPDGTCDTLNVETGEYVQKIGERNYQDGDTNSNTLVTDGTKTHYKLSSPIITKVDVQGFPHAYKNGHIQLSSGSTEPSLTPTVTYKVPVSRVGQIASNTKSNLRQTIKLDQLEILAYQSLINAEYENLLVQNSAESAASFTNLSTNDPKDELYYMLKHLIEENQPVQNMLDKINLFYLYGLLSDEHYFDLLLGGEEDVY